LRFRYRPPQTGQLEIAPRTLERVSVDQLCNRVTDPHTQVQRWGLRHTQIAPDWRDPLCGPSPALSHVCCIASLALPCTVSLPPPAGGGDPFNVENVALQIDGSAPVLEPKHSIMVSLGQHRPQQPWHREFKSSRSPHYLVRFYFCSVTMFCPLPSSTLAKAAAASFFLAVAHAQFNVTVEESDPRCAFPNAA
jgi:hypothetical protein